MAVINSGVSCSIMVPMAYDLFLSALSCLIYSYHKNSLAHTSIMDFFSICIYLWSVSLDFHTDCCWWRSTAPNLEAEVSAQPKSGTRVAIAI